MSVPIRIAFCHPVKPGVSEPLRLRNEKIVEQILDECEHEVRLFIDNDPVARRPSDFTPWSRVSRVRNRLLRDVPLHQFTHVFWCDADVVYVPSGLLNSLVQNVENGVLAPMVLIENSPTFYDWSAFIISGSEVYEPRMHGVITGRNLTPHPPYWPTEPRPSDRFIPMDCVGTCYLISTDVYKSGARHEDHPSFTDHHSVCATAREMNRPVRVDRSLTVEHANLPEWGEAWH